MSLYSEIQADIHQPSSQMLSVAMAKGKGELWTVLELQLLLSLEMTPEFQLMSHHQNK
jgi:UDP-N-acetyl-D-mannosaminuronic acid transferase (WecB/TagA/CpsF family)